MKHRPRRIPRLTAKAVEAFRVAKRWSEIEAKAPLSDADRETYRAVQVTLDRELDIRPWEESALDVQGGEPPAWCNYPDAWHRALALRQALEQAVGELEPAT